MSNENLMDVAPTSEEIGQAMQVLLRYIIAEDENPMVFRILPNEEVEEELEVSVLLYLGTETLVEDLAKLLRDAEKEGSDEESE